MLNERLFLPVKIIHLIIKMRCLRIIVVLFFLAAGAHAQTLSLYDLTNLANLNSSEAGNYLIQGKAFKRLYSQQVDGLNIEHYQSTTTKTETVIIGNGIKTADGKLLHLVKYNTTQSKHILDFIAQAPATGLSMSFQGSDATRNIYLFANFLYTVNIYLNNDNSAGDVEVQQKDYLDY